MSKLRLTAVAIVLVAPALFCGVGCGGGSPATTGSAGTSGGSAGTSAAAGTSGGTAGTSATAGTSGGTAGTSATAGTSGGTAGSSSGSAGMSGTAGAGGGTGGSVAGGGRGGATGGRGGAAGGTTGAAGASGRGGATGGRGGAAGGSAGTTGTGGSGTPTVFFLDVSGRVLSAVAENPMPKVLVASAGSGPDGIAVDVAGGHIFWTNMGDPSSDDGYIRRSNLDGSNVVTLVPAGGTYTPKQMRIDLPSGKMYWSDREGMRVMRANMDGSSVETLVTTGTTATDRMDLSRWCVGMALDTAGGFFYWTQKGGDNAGVGTIRRAHIQMPSGQTSTNRTDIEILYSGLPEPIDIDLDLEGGMIYWADRGDDTINRGPIEIPAGRTAANRTDRQILVPGVREAIGVSIDKRRGRLYYTSGVSNGALGRANLDGTSKQEIGVAAMTGIVVVDLP